MEQMQEALKGKYAKTGKEFLDLIDEDYVLKTLQLFNFFIISQHDQDPLQETLYIIQF